MAMRKKIWCVAIILGALVMAFSTVEAQTPQSADDRAARIANLERMLEELAEQVRALQAEQEADKEERSEYQKEVTEKIDEAVETIKAREANDTGGFDIGGYGEIHANFNQGSDKDQIDIHRFVLDFNYDFEDWIRFRSELEVEHAFISDDDGEISLEQFYVDFMFHDKLNLRIGRFLTPLGIINQRHEPPLFYGVERPNVDKVIIPTTWSSDGVGIFGNVTRSLTYELYAAVGLDGSKFDPKNGIRGGRIKERPSLNDIAFMGRVDYYPFVHFSAPAGQTLRLGLGGYTGGVDNGDQGKNPGGLSGVNIHMGVVDFEYTLAKFDLRGEFAFTRIDNASKLSAGVADPTDPGVAKEIVGWYIEPAYHVMPDSWKKGRWSESDAVVFARYEDFDTQHTTVSGRLREPGGERQEWTMGINFYFTPSLVLKADYQITEDDSATEPNNRLNFGMGMMF